MFKNKFWMKIAKPVNNCLTDLNYFFFSSIYISVTDLTPYFERKQDFNYFHHRRLLQENNQTLPEHERKQQDLNKK